MPEPLNFPSPASRLISSITILPSARRAESTPSVQCTPYCGASSRRPSARTLPASTALATVPRAVSSAVARPLATARVPIHGCSNCSVGSVAVAVKVSGASGEILPSGAPATAPTARLAVAEPARVERRSAVASMASSANRAISSKPVIPIGSLAVSAPAPASRRRRRSPSSRRRLTVPVRRGAAASDHSPPSVTVESKGIVLPAIRDGRGERNRGEAAVGGDPAVVPFEIGDPHVPVGDGEPRLAQGDVRALDGERRRCRQPQRKRSPPFERVDGAGPAVAGGGLGCGREPQPAVRGGDHLDVLARECDVERMRAQRAFERRARRGERSCRRHEVLCLDRHLDAPLRHVAAARRSGRQSDANLERAGGERRRELQRAAARFQLDRAAVERAVQLRLRAHCCRQACAERRPAGRARDRQGSARRAPR